MKRIAIMGCPGAGKSTLARALGAALDLPVHHLDVYYWQPGWQEGDCAVFAAQLSQIVARDTWIIDGGFTGLEPDEGRFREADAVILLERSVWLCLFRILKRWALHRNMTRPDMAEGCFEKLDWEFVAYIWSYRRKVWPQILEKAKRHGSNVIYVKRDPDVNALAAEISGVGQTSLASP